MNHILNRYLPFLMKSPFFLSILDTFWAIFWHFSCSTSINDSLTIELNYLLNWITTILFELNNCLNWILGNQYWIDYWIESIFAEIQTLNWIVLGIAQGYHVLTMVYFTIWVFHTKCTPHVTSFKPGRYRSANDLCF